MDSYEFADNKTTDRLNEDFVYKFKSIYRELSLKGKNSLLKYLPIMYKKWYYSTCIEDTVLTPQILSEFSGNGENIYPIMRINSVKRLTSPEFIKLKYSITSHPVCTDFKALLKAFENGIIVDENMEISFEDIKNINTVISCDPHYISYLIMLAIELECIEKMPSVGVEKYCVSYTAKEVMNMDSKKLLEKLFHSAVKIASDFLSNTYPGIQKNVTTEQIYNWLSVSKRLDDVYEEAYGDISVESSLAFENMDELEIALTADMYTKGIALDKWFLTPFSSYFRFIDTFYLYEYSIADEMLYILNAIEIYNETGENHIMDSALYSPCTAYKVSRLGAEFLNIRYDGNPPVVYNTLTPDEILTAALEPESPLRKRAAEICEPVFYIHHLKISSNNDELFEIETPENYTLDDINKYIIRLLKNPVMLCKSYRFYKLPESPFTEYTPLFINKRGPHTHDHTISDVMEKGEHCFYEIVYLNDGKNQKTTLKIQLEDITFNDTKVKYPICKTLKN